MRRCLHRVVGCGYLFLAYHSRVWKDHGREVKSHYLETNARNVGIYL